MRKGEEDQSALVLRSIAMVLLGGAVGVLVALLITFVAAVFISKGILTEENHVAITAIACLMGGFVGGAIVARNAKGKRMVTALVTAGVMFLMLLTIGVLLYQNLGELSGWLPAAAGCLCGGVLAGLFRGKPKKKRRK